MSSILRATPVARNISLNKQGHRLAAYSSSTIIAVKTKNDNLNEEIQEHWQAVYLACRNVFLGPHKSIRKSRIVAKRLRSAKATSHPLVEHMDINVLTNTAQQLLRKGVFSNEALARSMFPDVFEAESSAPQCDKVAPVDSMASLHNVQSAEKGAQIEATKITTSIESLADEKLDSLATASALPTPAKPPAGELETTIKSTTVTGNDGGVEGRLAADEPQLPTTTTTQEILNSIDGSQSVGGNTSQRMSLAEKYPMLAVGKFPYQAQHVVLTRTQQLLEECFYDYARKHLPHLIKARNWDSAACVELSECIKMCQKPGRERSMLLTTGEAAGGRELDEVLQAMSTLRNSAVHRNLHPARNLSSLLRKAIQFTEIAQDNVRGRRLAEVLTVMDGLVAQMETGENELDAWMSGEVHEIQEKRRLLDSMEADLWRDLQARDKKSRHYAQECLEAAALDIFEKPVETIGNPTGQEPSGTVDHDISQAQAQTPAWKPWSLVGLLRS